jgi:uroporphyrinogen III methyltransferase/synthase
MQKVLITRPRAQANPFAEDLRKAGFEPVIFPVIEIRPIDDNLLLKAALHQLDQYDWLVVTSVNGVKIVWDELSNMGIERIPQNLRVAAIGPKTAEALQAHGTIPTFIPDEYVAEALLPGLGNLQGCRVLLPRAEIARQALPEAIRQAGGTADEIAVYRTLPAEPDPQGLLALRAGVQVVTLTSPSTVQNFVAMARTAGLDPLALPDNPVFACIGPVTAQAAQAENLPRLIVAKEYTTHGLIEAMQRFETR